MAILTVRNLEEEVVRALRIRASEHGRSAEAEHREILRQVLTGHRATVSRAAVAARLADFRCRMAERVGGSAAALIEESRAGRVADLTGDP